MKVTLVTLVAAWCMNAQCSGALPADILSDSGVKGGLVVVLGCDDQGSDLDATTSASDE